MTLVYVKNRNGQPLMPTTPAVARLLLKQKKAKVIRRCPFQIKLLYETTGFVQPCLIAEDTGSGTLGAAAVTHDGEVCYMSEVTVRNDIADAMAARRKYRRNRRGRKTRYRKARFDNRKNSIRKDRFSPTMRSKIDAHEKEIRTIRDLLPASPDVLILETGTFDPHLLKNPALANERYRHWGYRQGTLYGYANTRAYILTRDRYTCGICKGRHRDPKLEVHHIIYRSNGGSDDPENLITLCHHCHSAVHDGKASVDSKGMAKGTLSFATQMNSIRKQLLKQHPEATETFGYITKENRQGLGLPKRHCIDAAVAASGGNRLHFSTDRVFLKRCIPAGDHQQTKGVRSQQRIHTGKIQEFRKYDKVRYHGREYFIKGRMSSGYAVLMDISGKKADFSDCRRKTPKLVDMQRIGARSTWMVTEEAVTLNTA